MEFPTLDKGRVNVLRDCSMILETADDGPRCGCLVDPKGGRRTDACISFGGGNQGTKNHL